MDQPLQQDQTQQDLEDRSPQGRPAGEERKIVPGNRHVLLLLPSGEAGEDGNAVEDGGEDKEYEERQETVAILEPDPCQGRAARQETNKPED